MNRSKPGSHVCNLDVIASPAILLPRGILRKAGKEEEKPWEINLMAQMGSALACVLVFAEVNVHAGVFFFTKQQ